MKNKITLLAAMGLSFFISVANAASDGAWLAPTTNSNTQSQPAPVYPTPVTQTPAAASSSDVLLFTSDYPNAMKITTPKPNTIHVVITDPAAITGHRFGVITYGKEKCDWVKGKAMMNIYGNCSKITTGMSGGTGEPTTYIFSVAK